MALTHNDNNTLADAATDVTRHGGLSEFGRAVVDELNDLGIMIDLSHASEATALDAIGQSQAPAILSHSGARGVCDHPRNATDEVLRALANKGGVCMVTFAAGFVSPDVAKLWSEALIEQRRMVGRHPDSPSEVQQSMDTWFAERPVVGADIARVADHIDHIRDVSGIDHVGIGSDFDGAPQVAAGLDDVSTYPQLFYHLRDRGYSDADLKAIAGRNVLRVWRQTEVVRNRRRP